MFNSVRNEKNAPRIYLDHAASTPTHPLVIEAMMPYITGNYGNPSAIHAEGRTTRRALEAARSTIATIHSVKPAGIIFTAGGTEANNIAIVGFLKKLHHDGKAWDQMEVITTAIEHPSLTETLNEMSKLGVIIKQVQVDNEGKIFLEDLKMQLSIHTVLCTFAYVNSEIGVVQKVHAIARTIRSFEQEQGDIKIALHIDAAQAPLWLPCDLPRLDADFITLDGAKCGGPKGIGAVVARKAGHFSPIQFGGGQETGVRPGTENVAGIVGLARALLIAQTGREARAEKIIKVRDEALKALTIQLPEAILNGPTGLDRIANNINVSLVGLDTEYAVVVLDQAGIAASTKSACAGAGSGESVVVKTITGDPNRARSTIRLTLHEESKVDEVIKAFNILSQHVAHMGTLTR